MTIEEAKAAKGALEHTILCALRQFSADTGARVARVDVDFVPVLGSTASYRVEAEVML